MGFGEREYLLGTSLGVVVDCEITYRSSKGHEISGHQASVSDHRPNRCCFFWGLSHKILTTASDSNDNSNQAWKPLPSLPDMNRSVSQQGRQEAQCTDDANSNVDTDLRILIYGGNGLPAYYRSEKCESCDGTSIQEKRENNKVEPGKVLLVSIVSLCQVV